MNKLTENLNQRIIITALLLIVFQSGSIFSAQETITLSALQDNILYEDAAGSISNGQGKYLYSGKDTTGLIIRALVRFMLAEFCRLSDFSFDLNIKGAVTGGLIFTLSEEF